MSGRPAMQTVRLLSFEEEGRRFRALRFTLAWETTRAMMTYARLRLSLVVVLSSLFWACLYGLFLEAFVFLDSLHADVVSLLFNAFFSSLMLMLIFSTGILLFGGMYCSPEARLLLTLPVRAETIFGHKFQEAMWFSGWGFVLLGSPMLVAYGVERQSSWPYFVLLLPFMLSFVVIPAAIGSIACIAMVAWLPRLRIHALAVTVAGAAGGALWIGASLLPQGRVDTMSAAWFEDTFARLAITEQKLFPSWWLTSGLVEAASFRGGAGAGWAPILEALEFLALLVANGMALHLFAGWLARVAYRRGSSLLTAEAPQRRQRPMGWFDQALVNAGSAAGRPLRLMLVKDLRLFRRDISQWSQFLIFFGLLGIYFLNLRSFNYNNSYAAMIGYLNLAVVGLILSTFTTRFVYPMISLEGRRFWILSLLPVHRDHIVWSKFLFSSIGGVVPCCLLILLSDLMLGIRPELIAIHEFCCLVLCLGLSGIAVGLGARMPDLRESSPAKISAGFGGTLSLVLSSLFIMVVVIAAALPTHAALLAPTVGTAALDWRPALAWVGGPWGRAASLVFVGLLGLTATAVPLRLGLRTFRTLEP